MSGDGGGLTGGEGEEHDGGEERIEGYGGEDLVCGGQGMQMGKSSPVPQFCGKLLNLPPQLQNIWIHVLEDSRHQRPSLKPNNSYLPARNPNPPDNKIHVK